MFLLFVSSTAFGAQAPDSGNDSDAHKGVQGAGHEAPSQDGATESPTATASRGAKPEESPEETPERIAPSTLDTFHSTNLAKANLKARAERPKRDYQREIEAARVLRREREHEAARKLLLGLLDDKLPPEYRRAVLFELAMVAQDDKQLGRAQQILAQYLQLFPGDPTVPAESRGADRATSRCRGRCQP